MRCRLCNVDKLSREFPRRNVTDTCNHPPLYCLRCVTSQVRLNWKCPYENCDECVAEDSERLREFEEDLLFMFPLVDETDVELLAAEDGSDGQEMIYVATLSGDKQAYVYSSDMTVGELKMKIKLKTQASASQQRLLYNEQELEQYKPDGKFYTLADYDVKPFSTLLMMIVLFEIPEDFNSDDNHVIFDLSWNYPSAGRDFLDASCLMFMGDTWYDYIDWNEKASSSVWHSGDKLDDKHRVGHHRLDARLKGVPKCVSHLFFVLSSFRSPSVGLFPNPTVEFYDACDEKRKLPHATFEGPLDCQALIMCCVCRVADNHWVVYEGGQQSAGNTQTYEQIEDTLTTLVKSNVFPGVSMEKGVSLLHAMTDEEDKDYQLRCRRRVVAEKVLDLAFAMDCTGSMGSYIEQARQNIRAIAEDIVRLENVSLNLALVEYRDHPPQDATFITRVLNFTSSIQHMKTRLDSCAAGGGGDTPEAVADALFEVKQLSWRSDATKICVLISDAPPHGLGCSGDAFPSGCPSGHDPMKTAKALAEKGVTIYVVGCEPSITPYRDWFTALAHLTGGQYVPLASARTLPQIIVGGAQEEMSLQRLRQDVESEIAKFDVTSGSVSQTEVVQAVLDKLRRKGAKTKHLVSSSGKLAGPSAKAMELFEKGSMAEVRMALNRSGGACPSGALSTVTGDEYLAVEEDVSYEQAERLVHRSLMASRLK